MTHAAVLHCLLEDSNLLGYERELLEQGADDVHQLQELDEEDFRRLCVAVGMAGKPLHMMRFSRALQRSYHHGNMTESHPTGPLPTHPASTGTTSSSFTASQTVSTLEMVGLSGQLSQDTHLRTCKIEPQDDTIPRPFWKAHGPGDLRESSTHTMAPNTGEETTPTSSLCHGNVMPRDTWQAWHRSTTPTSPNLKCIPFDELVDELTPTQSQLGPPPFSPSVWDRKRAELIRKSSTIYGGHMAKRRHLPLTAHEEGVNEAAFQLCLRDPTLLVRRDELFLLARRAVKKRGYMGGHGDQKGSRSNSPSLMTGSHGQKRSRPSIDGFHGDQMSHTPRTSAQKVRDITSPCVHLVPTLKQAVVVPRPSDYTTLYTLPVWTQAAAAALRGTPTTGSPDHSMSTARRLQSLDETLMSRQEGGSPSSLEECNSAYFTSQVPVLRDLSPPLHTSHLSPPLYTSSYSNTSDAHQLVEHVNRSANEAVQLLSSFTMQRPQRYDM